MEPRPQRPRPQTPPPGTPPNGGQQAQQIGPDPSQYTPHSGQPGQDPAAFVAPPRMEYDYSPLDLQPPGQRRKRQIIAGIIGALVVVAIGALIVAGWMALREDDNGDTPVDTNNRVAELNSPATSEADADGNTTTEGESTPSADQAATEPPTEIPPSPTPNVIVYDANTIRAELPVVESMPGAFEDSGETPQDLPAVTDAIGGGPEAEELLATNGWQAGISKNYTSLEPEVTGSTLITVSVHAFQDDASAQAMLLEFNTILQSYNWTPVEMEQLGDGSRMLTWTDPESGNEWVTIYVVHGQLVYRVNVQGPPGFDSSPNAIHVVNQIVGP